MSFEDALTFIGASKPLGSRLGLARVLKLCALLGDPQDKLNTVHVAGTNGKGSTAVMIASALYAAGHKTGLYLSPYIGDVCEGMRIDGRQITRGEFAATAAVVMEKAKDMAGEGEPPTEFEIETAIAFLWFCNSGCRTAVIETGLGGRLDATNVIKHPLISVITSISYDHVNILGDTLGKIAFEKCGILKPGGIAVCYPLQQKEAMDVIRMRAAEECNMLTLPDPDSIRILHAGLDGTAVSYGGLSLHVPFIGRHQAWNAATAVEALRALNDSCGLPVADAQIAQGIASASLPARQELLCRNPVVLLDGAHNLDKLTALAETMREHLSNRRTAVIMGMLRDKDYEPSIAMIAKLAHRFIACQPKGERALPSHVTADIAARHCRNVQIIDDYKIALSEALQYAGNDGAVVVCGSFYLAMPVRGEYLSS